MNPTPENPLGGVEAKSGAARFGSSLLHSESDRAKSRLMKMKEAENELEKDLNMASAF